jgi:hypothetical protein
MVERTKTKEVTVAMLVSKCLAAKGGHETECVKVAGAIFINSLKLLRQRFINRNYYIKQLFTEFPDLFLLSYEYILFTPVSGPLKKHLDSLKPTVNLLH